MRELDIVTIKPLTGEIEYQVREGQQVIRHGDVVVMAEMGEETTAGQIRAAAEADATAKGLLPPEE